MDEQQRLLAINQLNDWRRESSDVDLMVTIVLRAEGQPTVGHLARFNPEVFDLLHEEAEAFTEGE